MCKICTFTYIDLFSCAYYISVHVFEGVCIDECLITNSVALTSIILTQRKSACQHNLHQEIRQFFPGEDKVKVFHLDKPGDPLLCLRQVGAARQRSLYYRDHRPHLMVEQVEVEDQVSRLLIYSIAVTCCSELLQATWRHRMYYCDCWTYCYMYCRALELPAKNYSASKVGIRYRMCHI